MYVFSLFPELLVLSPLAKCSPLSRVFCTKKSVCRDSHILDLLVWRNIQKGVILKVCFEISGDKNCFLEIFIKREIISDGTTT